MSGALFSLTGRVACVTGASAGIGRAIATALAGAGASVVGVARRQALLDEWVGEVEGLADGSAGHVAGCVADLGLSTGWTAMVAHLSESFGAPDILVNAAGVNPRQPADEVTPESWQRTIDLNLSVPFFLAQALVPAMRAKGWGRVINIASLQSERAFAGGIAYGASKGGVAQLTRAMAEAWSADGINCNALAPGFFPTDLTAAVFDDKETAARHAAQTCIGRNGRLDDLAGPAVFLASPAADYVTGQVLFVDGGYTAK